MLQIHKTHKTHHGLDLGETTTFPLIVFYVLGHGANIQMSFCPDLNMLNKAAFHFFILMEG